MLEIHGSGVVHDCMSAALCVALYSGLQSCCDTQFVQRLIHRCDISCDKSSIHGEGGRQGWATPLAMPSLLRRTLTWINFFIRDTMVCAVLPHRDWCQICFVCIAGQVARQQRNVIFSMRTSTVSTKISTVSTKISTVSTERGIALKAELQT